MALACKFSDILEQVIAGNKRSHLLKVELDTNNNNNFDHIGHLTQMGMSEYWRQLDNTMKDFDCGKTELEPNPLGKLPGVRSESLDRKPAHKDDSYRHKPWNKVG